MECQHCRSDAFEKKITRSYTITVAGLRRWKKRKKKIVVWTEEDIIIVCPSCRKRAANEDQRRDSPKAWKAYMKKNPEYLRQLLAKRSQEPWRMSAAI